MSKRAFISYRVSDTQPVANHLASELKRAFGDEAVFLDIRNLEPAGQWPAQLRDEVARSDVVLALIGKGWLKAQDDAGRRRLDSPQDWVRQEMAASLASGKAVLPLYVNDAPFLRPSDIGDIADIAMLATAEGRALRDRDWESDFTSLVGWLEARGFEPAVSSPAGAEDAARATPIYSGNPYKGLDPFGFDDAGIFFGRERDTHALVQRVAASRFVAVVGASGTGKSSLVAAGLMPALAAGALPAGKEWVWLRVTPAEAGADPFRALALGLAPRLASAPSAATLAERLRISPSDIDTLADEVLAGRPAAAELLVFVDQFEELFTARVAETHREPFAAFLTAVAQSRRVRTVLTLRADYFEHCTRLPELAELLREGGFPLAPPGVKALEALVERPARAAGLSVEPEVVERLVAFAATAPGALALVEYTLERLYVARSDGRLTLAAYEALGGVAGAIEARGEAAVRDASGQLDEAAVGRVFRALVTVDEDGGATRQRARLDDFEAAERALVERLTTARLLVTDTDEVGERIAEVAHEAVLRSWPRFGRWIDENEAFLLFQRRLAVHIAGGAALTEGPLAEAEQWLTTHAVELSDEERAYVERSVAARDAEQARRDAQRAERDRLEQEAVKAREQGKRRLIVTVATILLVVTVAVGIWQLQLAKRERLQAEAARAVAERELAAERAKRVPIEPDMVRIEPGEFVMGSPETDKEASPRERPQRTVRIARPFLLGRYEVTFAEYDRFALATERRPPSDSGFGGGRRPVINVTWNEAVDYAKWLSNQTGKRYRLPTEAEWEYAARAGTPTPRFWPDGAKEDACTYANVLDRANAEVLKRKFNIDWVPHACDDPYQESAPVDAEEFKPNALGLYQMLGNVWEWVQDCWHESYEGAPDNGAAWLKGEGADCGLRVVRGGAWDNTPRNVRSANRHRYAPGDRNYSLGFRLAQDIE